MMLCPRRVAEARQRVVLAHDTDRRTGRSCVGQKCRLETAGVRLERGPGRMPSDGLGEDPVSMALLEAQLGLGMD